MKDDVFSKDAMPPLKIILESLLLVSEEPLTLDKIKSALPSADIKDIRDTIQKLKEEYNHAERGFHIAEVAGGYQFRTHPDCALYIRNLLKPSPQHLSAAALETLAIVAYKQPVMRSDIEHLRGVDAGGVMRMLLDRKLIRILGRKELPGRPLLYGTTRFFLEVFGLKDIKELPTPGDMADMARGISPGTASEPSTAAALSSPENTLSQIKISDL